MFLFNRNNRTTWPWLKSLTLYNYLSWMSTQITQSWLVASHDLYPYKPSISYIGVYKTNNKLTDWNKGKAVRPWTFLYKRMVAGKTKIQGGQWYKQWEPQIHDNQAATTMLMKCKMTHSHKTIANIPSKHCQSGNAIKWCQPIKHLSCSCQLHGHLPFSHGVLHLKLSAQLKEYDAKTFKTLVHHTYNCPMLMTWLYDVVPWGKSLGKQNAKPKGMQAVVFFLFFTWRLSRVRNYGAF